MKNSLEAYKRKLEKAICEYMDMSVSDRSAAAVNSMLECWKTVDKMVKKHFSASITREEAEEWTAHMQNDDGTTGAHWSIDQTTNVAKTVGVHFDHIEDWQWWTAMNMVYSDYCGVAAEFGVGRPEFYAGLAKAFLFDKDGGEPSEKLAEYYQHIAKPEMEREY